MDPQAARNARRKAFQADLAKAYTEEEASPPEWVDLLERVRTATRAIRDQIADETARFVDEPDIRRALHRRELATERFRIQIGDINTTVMRLNLIAPNSRFTRGALDADELLRPLYRSERRIVSS